MNFNNRYNPLLKDMHKISMNNVSNNMNNINNMYMYMSTNSNNFKSNFNNMNNNNNSNMQENFKNKQMINSFPNNNIYLANNNNLYNNMQENKDDIITLYFEFSNKKQIYIYVNSNSYFRDVIRELREKYSWLNDLQIIDYKYNEKSVDYNKTLEENLIKDSSVIKVIENKCNN